MVLQSSLAVLGKANWCQQGVVVPGKVCAFAQSLEGHSKDFCVGCFTGAKHTCFYNRTTSYKFLVGSSHPFAYNHNLCPPQTDIVSILATSARDTRSYLEFVTSLVSS